MTTIAAPDYRTFNVALGLLSLVAGWLKQVYSRQRRCLHIERRH